MLSDEWLKNKNINVICSNISAGERFKHAVDKIKKTVAGNELLAAINTLTLFKELKITIDLNSHQLGVIPENITLASNLKGCGSLVYINFEHPGINADDGISSSNKDCIVLSHELIHAYHNLIGERVYIEDSQNKYAPHLHEEARTVGLGSFKNEPITENKIREELGLPRRLRYDIVDDDDQIRSFKKYPLFPLCHK